MKQTLLNYNFACWIICKPFCYLLIFFFKIYFFKDFFKNSTRMSNSLDPNQLRCFVGLDPESKLFKWASVQESLSTGFANNKGADRPALPHSLISAFVIRLWKVYQNLLLAKLKFSR